METLLTIIFGGVLLVNIVGQISAYLRRMERKARCRASANRQTIRIYKQHRSSGDCDVFSASRNLDRWYDECSFCQEHYDQEIPMIVPERHINPHDRLLDIFINQRN